MINLIITLDQNRLAEAQQGVYTIPAASVSLCTTDCSREMRAVAFIGSLVDTPLYGQLRLLKNSILVIDDSGIIARIEATRDHEEGLLQDYGIDETGITRLKVTVKSQSFGVTSCTWHS